MLSCKEEGVREKRMRRQKSCFQVFFFAPAITNHLFSFWIFTNTWSGLDLLLMLVRTKIIVVNEKVLDSVFTKYKVCKCLLLYKFFVQLQSLDSFNVNKKAEFFQNQLIQIGYFFFSKKQSYHPKHRAFLQH